jgi:hypothetical protein
MRRLMIGSVHKFFYHPISSDVSSVLGISGTRYPGTIRLFATILNGYRSD